MLRPERYDGEHQDLRDEYAREEYDNELGQQRRDAGCTEECEPDCDCVQTMLENEQERRDMEHDYRASRGV